MSIRLKSSKLVNTKWKVIVEDDTCGLIPIHVGTCTGVRIRRVSSKFKNKHDITAKEKSFKQLVYPNYEHTHIH